MHLLGKQALLTRRVGSNPSLPAKHEPNGFIIGGIMSYFKWVPGRQDASYHKMRIFELLNSMDCYLLKFENTQIPEHVDTVDNRKHFRLNITLSRPKSGGVFTSEKVIFSFGRITLFRPDKYRHSLSMMDGKMTMLSFGIAI